MSEPAKITSEVQKLEQSALVQLWTLDLGPLGGPQYHFHGEKVPPPGTLQFGSTTYAAMPIEAKGFAFHGTEQEPRPTIKIANLGGLVRTIIAEYGDLVGARVIRRRTFRKHLADGADPDATAQFSNDVFFVRRMVARHRIFIEWELGSSLAVDGVRLPFRKLLPRCQWTFKDGVNCPYAGPESSCEKTVAACSSYFGADNPLPYGGFPAVERLQLSF
jgi:lambda family phage minor tail protein L